jgi:hypothetical protein
VAITPTSRSPILVVEQVQVRTQIEYPAFSPPSLYGSLVLLRCLSDHLQSPPLCGHSILSVRLQHVKGVLWIDGETNSQTPTRWIPSNSCSPLPLARVSTNPRRLRPREYPRTLHRRTQSRGRLLLSQTCFPTRGSTPRGNPMPGRSHLDMFHVLRALEVVLVHFPRVLLTRNCFVLLDRNPFILFRTAFVRSGHVPADVEPDHRNLSRIAGEVWRRMTPAEKKKWNNLADEVKEEHKRVHPNYRYGTPMVRGSFAHSNLPQVSTGLPSTRACKKTQDSSPCSR